VISSGFDRSEEVFLKSRSRKQVRDEKEAEGGGRGKPKK
jgi:hypothetical protein